MGFLTANTAIIAAAMTIPLLVSLYFLKLRRRRVSVSSTLLWSMAVADMRANTPFEKLRRNLLLLLQLLVLGALLMAMARPTLRSTAGSGQRMILLLDHSASMNATDVAPTRLDRAKQLAMQLVENLHADGHRSSGGAMIMSFARHPQVIQPFTADQSLLRRAIGSIQPTDYVTHLDAALRVLEPLVSSVGDLDDKPPPIVYVISDGRIQDIQRLVGSGLELRYVKVGRQGGNVAIVSLSGRRHRQKPNRVQVLARLTNDGAVSVDTNLKLSVDGRVERVVPITVPGISLAVPGEQTIQFELDYPGAGLLELNCDHTDFLAADNTAWLTLVPPRQLEVLLVTSGNRFLVQAIEAAAVRRLVRVSPNQYEDQNPRIRLGEQGTPFDVIVFDRYRPQAAPVVNSLFIAAAPPLEQLLLRPGGGNDTDRQIVLDWKRNHPLMAHVALNDLLMEQPARIALPDSAQTLAVGQGGPVMALVTEGSIHYVIVGFDLLQSNWPLQISFPVFIRNCMQWLGAHGSAAGAFVVKPGQLPTLPDSGPARPLRYEGPATGPPFTRVGLYQATQHVDPPWHQLGVSLLNGNESHIVPLEQIALAQAFGAPTHISTAVIRREIWPWFAIAALVLLIIEWLVYTRTLQG